MPDEPQPDEPQPPSVTQPDEPQPDEPQPDEPQPPSVTQPDEPVPASVTQEPPSAAVMPVPRRTSLHGDPVSPMRALAGAAVAVAGVLLGIGALLWATDAPQGTPALQQSQSQSSGSVAPSPTAARSPSPEPVTLTPAPVGSGPAASPAAPKIALTVLNNSNVNGLARRAAATFRAKGWPIKLEGSFRGRIPVTTVYYAPGQQASAVLLQKEFPAIERVRPRFSTLPGSGLTVVLTRDYPA